MWEKLKSLLPDAQQERAVRALERIAEALERVSPPPRPKVKRKPNESYLSQPKSTEQMWAEEVAEAALGENPDPEEHARLMKELITSPEE